MRDSDVAYIKAMLWGIVGILYKESGLLDPIFWMSLFYILVYGFEFIFYRLKENGE